jgi:rRNA maturation protein Nop10
MLLFLGCFSVMYFLVYADSHGRSNGDNMWVIKLLLFWPYFTRAYLRWVYTYKPVSKTPSAMIRCSACGHLNLRIAKCSQCGQPLDTAPPRSHRKKTHPYPARPD